MSQAEEVVIEPDGSTTFESQPDGGGAFEAGAEGGTFEAGGGDTFEADGGGTFEADGGGTFEADGGGTFEADGGGTFEDASFDNETTFDDTTEEMMEEVTKGIDPAIYLLLAVFVALGVYFFFYYRKTKEEDDDFFSKLDGEKFKFKLPAEVEEYYQIKAKCVAAGWEPGKGPPPSAGGPPPNGPHRVLAQALMKRTIADIPIVTHIQKESGGMNKLYSQSMCSAKQWRAYQAAEAMVSAEVDEVRAEADEIEPGWSQVIWRQAMQYHNMLKQKHEMEAKAASEAAKQKKAEMDKVMAEKKKVEDAKAKEMAAEKAAQELIQAEEREKESKKAFSGGGLKKGFLEKGKKK